MKKLDLTQCLVYTLMDKLRPVLEIIVQRDDNCEDWNLEELVENMKRYIERNPLQNEWDLYTFIANVEIIQLTSALGCYTQLQSVIWRTYASIPRQLDIDYHTVSQCHASNVDRNIPHRFLNQPDLP